MSTLGLNLTRFLLRLLSTLRIKLSSASVGLSSAVFKLDVGLNMDLGLGWAVTEDSLVWLERGGGGGLILFCSLPETLIFQPVEEEGSGGDGDSVLVLEAAGAVGDTSEELDEPTVTTEILGSSDSLQTVKRIIS